MNAHAEKSPSSRLPYLVGGTIALLFVGLSLWQLDRGFDKRTERAAFEAQRGFSNWSAGMSVTAFEKLEVDGRWAGERQVLLENSIVRGQRGFFVLTPLRIDASEPLLLVNRGWIAPDAVGSLDIPARLATVRGRAGGLPRAGFKMGPAFTDGQSGWPRTAVFPGYAEMEAELGEAVQPFVLLLDPEDPDGFVRDWVPQEIGPGRHFAYALQWLLMSAVLAGLLIYNFRKRGFE